MKFLTTVCFLGAAALPRCGAHSPSDLLDSNAGAEEKLPIDDISEMLTTRALNPKCKITSVKLSQGSLGKKLTFDLSYDNQPMKTYSLNEIPDSNTVWSVESGIAAFKYWKFSYLTTDFASPTNLKSLTMTANETTKTFEIFDLKPLENLPSTDCSVK